MHIIYKENITKQIQSYKSIMLQIALGTVLMTVANNCCKMKKMQLNIPS